MGRLPRRDPVVIVVTGSECTGKSAVARGLAAHLDATYSGEFVREYLDVKGLALDVMTCSRRRVEKPKYLRLPLLN